MSKEACPACNNENIVRSYGSRRCPCCNYTWEPRVGLGELDQLRAENCELRERLAEAEGKIGKLRNELKVTKEFADEQALEIEKLKGYTWTTSGETKLARTEALLAEWVAWGNEAQLNHALGMTNLPPMPKEKP